MKLQEITNALEEIAPISYQESYDNSGLLIGDKKQEIKSALLCLDSTEAVIDEAIEKKCDLVIAHHPIIFSGLKRFNGNNEIERVVIKAIKNNIALYAMHTNLDNVSAGVNAKICQKLGIINTSILQVKTSIYKKLFTFCPIKQADLVRNALFEAGAGHIGDYSECSFNTLGFGTFKALENTQPFVGNVGERHTEKEEKIECVFPAHQQSKIVNALTNAHPYEEVAYDIVSLDNAANDVGSGMIGELATEMETKVFLEKIKENFSAAGIRYTKVLKEKVKRIAVCGGSGSFLLRDAIAQKADMFITADFKYHQFFEAENSIVIADIGHYESEQFTTELFYDILTKKFPTFAVHFSELNTNPINYL